MLELAAVPVVGRKYVEACPPRRLAFRFATRVVELTLSGATPVLTVACSAEPVPVLLTLNSDVELVPVSELVALTELAFPRLNTAPIPVPASALVATSATAVAKAPITIPLQSFIGHSPVSGCGLQTTAQAPVCRTTRRKARRARSGVRAKGDESV